MTATLRQWAGTCPLQARFIPSAHRWHKQSTVAVRRLPHTGYSLAALRVCSWRATSAIEPDSDG